MAGKDQSGTFGACSSSVETLEKENAYLQTIIDSVGSGIMVIQRNYEVTLMNATAESMMMNEQIADKFHPKCYEISHHLQAPCDGKEHPCPLSMVLESGERVKVMHRHKDAFGKERIIELTATPILDEEGNIDAIVEVAHDMTQLVTTQQELAHQSHHDALTDLPNRVLFMDRLEQGLKYAQRYNKRLAVLFLDIDRFKEVNDSLGHAVGDELLVSVATQLGVIVGVNDTVARMGGDEFAILVENLQETNALISIVTRITQALSEPILVGSHWLYVTFGVGIALYPNDAQDAISLLKNADAAMYNAKQKGRNRYEFYTQSMTQKAYERIVMETQLREAIATNALEVYFQRQVDAQSQTLIGMEALVRWNHPELGLLGAGRFVPMAEETGLIVALDEWVMRHAIMQWVAWHKKGQAVGILSLNLSTLRLADEYLIERITALLEELEAQPQWLMLEVTESQIMKNPQASIATLNALGAMGIKLAIDDFGTGYSSLAYLKALPINKIKIDQSFVRELPYNGNDAQIVKTIIAMAQALGLEVIAEGVETQAQCDFLLSLGCTQIQGFLFHRPSSGAAIEAQSMPF